MTYYQLTVEDWIYIIDFYSSPSKAFWKERTDCKWFEGRKYPAERERTRWNVRYAGKEINNINNKGYVHFKFQGKLILLHRLLWFIHTGKWPKYIDHINGNRADNRIENLREVTIQENSKNQQLSSVNKSGVIGVYKNTKGNRWLAQITIFGKQKFLGSFKSLEEAAKVRKAAEIEYGFSPTHGRK